MSTTIIRPAFGLIREIPERHAKASDPDDLHASAIELRLLGTHKAHLVDRLAALDDARALAGQVLVAVVGGQSVAALSLSDGRVVANPFIPTLDAVALLRLRREQLLSVGHEGRLAAMRGRFGATRSRRRGQAGRGIGERARREVA
jgi:hypothetical protein